VSWNTTTVSNATHRLTATVTDSKGKTDTAARSVTVANGVFMATLTNPKAGLTLSGVVTVQMRVSGSTASTRTFTLYQDGEQMWTKTITGTSTTWSWDTGWWAADGTHVLKLKVTDSSGKSDITEKRVSVVN
jgi:hypothetical protein